MSGRQRDLRGLCTVLTEGKWGAAVRVEGALYARIGPPSTAALRAGPLRNTD